ncbi:3-phosphoshikimate 1-carboxyvinyltransferase [Pseudonocardiaceae bacterium YIM PH 21723]|nr:3-phosphoshikimate 1-carboxyvinyltransferase [Pseudonocardiaceae bacterium YIM PH 21723]
MNSTDQLTVQPLSTVDATVSVLGSKSYTNRYIGLASLAGTTTRIENALLSDDTRYFCAGIEKFGHVRVSIDEQANAITVEPTGEPMTAPAEEIYVGGAGTPIRFLISLAGLASGDTVLTGNARMQERPMDDLLAALGPLGVSAVSVKSNGSPPISVAGGSYRGGRTTISGGISSQFTSSLLISALRAEQDTEITVSDDMVSKPYINMTVAALAERGIKIERDGHSWFKVPAGAAIAGGTAVVEPDASGLSYFLAAAAITGGRITIPGIDLSSHQGDVGLAKVLESMGCQAEAGPDGITLRGGELRGVDVDMENMPDVVPTLAIVAAFAEGSTHITGIGNLRLKECDRISAVATELGKMGIRVEEFADAMTVHGGSPQGAVIDTYDDHRIAMCFAIAGLRAEGTVINDPGCVSKSFPTFWNTLDSLR